MIAHSRIIWSHIEAVRRARKSDPATSHAAAAKAERFAKTHAGRIAESLVRLNAGDRGGNPSSHGATAAHLAADTGLTVVQIDRRLHEMRKAGLIEVVQYNGEDLTRNGFRCWRLV